MDRALPFPPLSLVAILENPGSDAAAKTRILPIVAEAAAVRGEQATS